MNFSIYFDQTRLSVRQEVNKYSKHTPKIMKEEAYWWTVLKSQA